VPRRRDFEKRVLGKLAEISAKLDRQPLEWVRRARFQTGRLDRLEVVGTRGRSFLFSFVAMRKGKGKLEVEAARKRRNPDKVLIARVGTVGLRFLEVYRYKNNKAFVFLSSRGKTIMIQRELIPSVIEALRIAYEELRKK